MILLRKYFASEWMQRLMNTEFSDSETLPNVVSSQLSSFSDEARLQLLKAL